MTSRQVRAHDVIVTRADATSAIVVIEKRCWLNQTTAHSNSTSSSSAVHRMMRASVKGRDACSRETAGRGARPLPTSQPASQRTNERTNARAGEGSESANLSGWLLLLRQLLLLLLLETQWLGKYYDVSPISLCCCSYHRISWSPHWRIWDFSGGGWLWKQASIEGVWAYGRMKFERLLVRTHA